jgi:hypothetical protein
MALTTLDEMLPDTPAWSCDRSRYWIFRDLCRGIFSGVLSACVARFALPFFLFPPGGGLRTDLMCEPTPKNGDRTGNYEKAQLEKPHSRMLELREIHICPAGVVRPQVQLVEQCRNISWLWIIVFEKLCNLIP